MNSKDTKIVILGAGAYRIYDIALYQAFIKEEYHNTSLLGWNEFLKTNSNNGKILQKINLLFSKAQNKYSFGWKINKYNKYVIHKCEEIKPDLVFIYSGRHVYSKTIKKLRKIGCIIFAYNNDDPFAPYYPKYFWRHYIRALRYVDMSFVYRKKNIYDSIQAGCKRVEILKSYYIEEDNYICGENELIPDTPVVLFLGHQEDDERKEYMKALLDEKIQVGVPEKFFSGFEPDNKYLVKLKDTDVNYNRLLNSTKIGIVFLSKINNDTYTRRCFEIPAAGTFMLCPYTEELASMYAEGKEAVFYRNKEEFVSLVKYYLSHDSERNKIAENGRKRLKNSDYEVSDRVRTIMEKYNELM